MTTVQGFKRSKVQGTEPILFKGSNDQDQEFIQFLYVAKASCGEVRSQLYAALDQDTCLKQIAKCSWES